MCFMDGPEAASHRLSFAKQANRLNSLRAVADWRLNFLQAVADQRLNSLRAVADRRLKSLRAMAYRLISLRAMAVGD